MRWTRLAIAAVAARRAQREHGAAQDPVEQFYRGKTLNIIVGGAAGGGYDNYGRALGRHMSKYLPGNPAIVVQNMPGAGGNKAAGYMYAVAPKDGTAIGAAVSRRDPGAAARRHADPARSGEVHLCRQRQQRRLHLRGAHATRRSCRSRTRSRRRSSSARATRAAPRATCRRSRTTCSAPNSASSPAMPARARSRSRSSAARSTACAASATPACSG